MAVIRDMGKRGATLLMLDPRKIQIMPGLNARDMDSADTRAHVEALSASIEAQGFLGSHPLEVFSEGDSIYVAAGHCRLSAVMALIARGVAIDAVPCLSEARGTDQATRLINQVVSNSGQKLNLAEEGKVYRKLAAMGWVTAKIAKEVGRSEAHIRQALDFNAAPQEAHQLVSEGKVSATLAAKVTREEGGAKGVETLKAAVKRAEGEGKTKATPRHVEPRQPRAPKATPEPPHDNTMAALSLARRIVKRGDPRDFDSSEAMKALIRDYDDARAVFAEPTREAAE